MTINRFKNKMKLVHHHMLFKEGYVPTNFLNRKNDTICFHNMFSDTSFPRAHDSFSIQTTETSKELVHVDS